MWKHELSTGKKNILGRHIIAEIRCKDPKMLDNAEKLREYMEIAARKGGMTVLNSTAHKFTPQGASAVVVLAESHVSIHTWPELGYAALDIYTCGKDPEPVLEELNKLMPFEIITSMVVDRGPE